MTESVTPSEEPTRKRRRWGLIVVALCLLLGFAALGAATVWSWGNRAQVLEWAIATYLKGDKVEHVSLSVERADIDRLAIRDLRIEGETSVFVKSINADYVIDDLLIGSIDRFVAQKVRVVTGETAIEIDEIKGAATFSGDLGNLQELSAGLDFIRLRIAGQEFEPSRIEVDYRDDVLSVDGALSGPNGFVTMVAGGPINSETESFDVFLAGRFDAAATAAWIGPDAVDMSGYISSTVAAKFKNPAFFLEERSSDDPMLPEDLTVDGRINLALDRLVVGGVEIPTAQKDRIDFKLADLTFQEEVSAGRFAIALQVDKRSTPQLEFEKGTLQLAGAYAVDPDRLVVRFAEGPLVQLHDARIAQEVPVGGVMKLELLGDTNRLDVERTRQGIRHRVDGRLSWPAGNIAFKSEGHLSEPTDPVIFTLRGAFDATPALALSEQTRSAKGSGNIFLAGRISQPLLLQTDPTDPDKVWPGDIRLDGAFKLATTGLAIPGFAAAKPPRDSLEITLKGFNGSSALQRGRLAVAAKLDSRKMNDIAFREARLNLDGRVDSGARGYRFVPSFESALSVSNIETPALSVPDGLTFQFTGTENHVTLPLDLSAVYHQLTFAHLEADGLLKTDGKKQRIRLTIPQLSSRHQENKKYHLFATAGSIELPAAKIAAHGINASIETDGRSIDIGLEAGDIRHDGRPPLTSPLAFSAKGKVSGDKVRLTLGARQRYTPLRLRATLKHDLSKDVGRIDFELPKVKLDPKNHTVIEVFPPAANWLTSANGSSSMKGHLLWDKDLVSGQMTVALDDLDLVTEDMTLTGLTGTIDFIELIPLSMPPRQRINGEISFAEVGPLPVQLEFQLREDGKIAIQDLDLGVAGGRMRTRGLIEPGDALKADAKVFVQSVDLSELFKIMGLEGLAGTGRINGEIPISLRESGLSIANGSLKAAGPGRLQYSGTALQEQLSGREDTVGTVAQVLSDFRYTKLSMELNKGMEGKGVIRLRMNGANPKVYDGYPFAFNISIESDFDKLGRIAFGGVKAVTDIVEDKAERPSGGIIE